MEQGLQISLKRYALENRMVAGAVQCDTDYGWDGPLKWCKKRFAVWSVHIKSGTGPKPKPDPNPTPNPNPKWTEKPNPNPTPNTNLKPNLKPSLN